MVRRTFNNMSPFPGEGGKGMGRCEAYHCPLYSAPGLAFGRGALCTPACGRVPVNG